MVTIDVGRSLADSSRCIDVQSALQVFYALRELQHACTANLIETRVVGARLDALQAAVEDLGGGGVRVPKEAPTAKDESSNNAAYSSATCALYFTCAAIGGGVFGTAFALVAMSGLSSQ